MADNLCSFEQYILKAVMAHAFHPTAEAEADRSVWLSPARNT